MRGRGPRPHRLESRARSEWKRKHQPAEHDGRHDEPGEQHPAKAKLLGSLVPRNQGEHERDEERKEGEQEEVAVHGLLAAERDIVGVDDDEQVQESGHDQEGVAVLIADRPHITRSQAEGARNEVRDADTHMREGRQRDQRLREIEWKQPPIDRQTDGKHQRDRDEEGESFESAPLPQVTGARNRPGRKTQKHEATRLKLFCCACWHRR